MALITKPFRPAEYLKPKDVGEAISLLGRYDGKAKVIAGGTDIFVERNASIEALVDIEGLKLSYIRENGGEISIGAGTTIKEIAESELLKGSALGVMREAAEVMATPQIRNVATIGGNVCYAVPSGDFAPALLALGARVKAVGGGGEREIGLEEFFLGNKRTVLKGDEIVVEFKVPSQGGRTGSAFTRVGRTSGDIALVNAAVWVRLDGGGEVEEGRIALGAVGPTPLRAKEAEGYLKGKKASSEEIREAGRIAAGETKPITDHRTTAEYRREVSAVLVQRALVTALERAL